MDDPLHQKIATALQAQTVHLTLSQNGRSSPRVVYVGYYSIQPFLTIPDEQCIFNCEKKWFIRPGWDVIETRFSLQHFPATRALQLTNIGMLTLWLRDTAGKQPMAIMRDRYGNFMGTVLTEKWHHQTKWLFRNPCLLQYENLNFVLTIKRAHLVSIIAWRYSISRGKESDKKPLSPAGKLSSWRIESHRSQNIAPFFATNSNMRGPRTSTRLLNA